MGLLDTIAQAGQNAVGAYQNVNNTFWNNLAGVTPPWMPVAGFNPQATALQKQQEQRLAALQQQQVINEQNRQKAISQGTYPVNLTNVQEGSATQKVYIDPNTGGYTYTPSNAQIDGGTTGDIGDSGATDTFQNTVTYQPFDYEGATDRAYASLEGFYNKLLDFAGGRLDLAKRTLEYIYSQGMRESAQDYEASVAEQGLLFPQEQAQKQTDLNKRGVYFSGFGAEDRTNLQKSQDLRRLAVERAKENRNTRLETERGLNLEKETGAFNEEKFNLERQRRKEAQGMAIDEYNIKGENYQAETDKALEDEGRNTQKIANQTYSGSLSNTGTGTSGGMSSDDKARFRQYMQSTGRQGELDRATAGSTQEGSAFYDLMKKYRGMY
jgi:hypothetical protein